MNKKAKRAIVIAAAAVLLIAAAVTIFLVVSADSAGYRSISIAEIFGKVITQNNGKTYEAYKNMRLSDGYVLTTDPDSYTRMVLDDDKYVKLEQESHAVFEALGDSKRHLTAIRLEKGALTTEITKPLSETESYIINTPNAVLAVRGTLFRVEVKQETNGDYYCDVYTYGGCVVSHRIMPDGTHVDEEILIPAGYKATIKMDEIITVYIEEEIEEKVDNIDPLYISEVNDEDLVNVYNASRHGHEMFLPTEELWNEISDRVIDLSKYKSVYDGTDIPPFTSGDTGNSDSTPDNSAGNSGSSSGSPDISEGSDQSSSDSSDEDPSSSTSEKPGSTSSAPSGSDDDNTHDVEPAPLPPQSSTSPPVSEPTPVESTPSSSINSVPTPGISGGTSPETSSSDSSSEPSESDTPSSTDSGNSDSSSDNTSPDTPPSSPSHTHAPVETRVEPTCVDYGRITRKCSVCGELLDETIIPANGHIETSKTTPAACTENGKTEYFCGICKTLLRTVELPATGHTEIVSTTSATCTESGKTVVECAVCNEILGETMIPAKGHTETSETTPATCTDTGKTVYFCDVCEVILRTVDIPATGHITETVTIPAACTEDGKITVTCSVCNETLRGEIIPATGHRFGEYISDNNATCLKDGTKTAVCEVCGETDTITDEGSILPHTPETITVPSTCTVHGSETVICKVCETIITPEKELPLAEHTEVTETVDATCTEDGKITVTCTVCNEALREEIIPATGHSFGEYISDNNATCLKDGTKTAVCKVCGETDTITDEGSILPHTPETVTVPSTCTEHGSETVICKVCETVITPERELPLAEHTEVTETVDPACTEDGKITVTCSVCNEILREEIIPATGHSFGEYISDNNATCLKDGTKTAVCEVCGETDTITDEGSILPHTPETITVPSTCTVHGSETVICKVCETVITPERELPLAEHTEVTETVDATCTEDGKITVTCSVCGEIINETVIDAPGHDEITETEGNIETVKCSVCGKIFTQTNTVTGVVYPVEINAEIFPDETFRQYVLDNFDNDGDGELSLEESSAVTSIDVSGLDVDSLEGINVFAELAEVKHTVHVEDGELDISGIGGIDASNVSNVRGGEPDGIAGIISGITEGSEIGFDYDPGTGKSMMFTLVPDEDSTFAPETPEGVEINAENFPDEKFRTYVSTNFDKDGNGYLSQEECDAVTTIDVNGTYSVDGGISTLKGIENFSKLNTLYCYYNSELTSLDVSKNTALTSLQCHRTQITSLDVSKNTALTCLYCYGTQIASLDVSNNTELTYLLCDNTQITLLDVSKNTALTYLDCHNTQIPFVDINNNPNIIVFCADGNKHTVHIENGVFDLNSIDGFDISRIVDDVEGMDENGVISGITEGTNITYIYDCKGTGEGKFQMEFTLVPDESSTFDTVFDGTIYMDDGSVTITSTGFTQGSSPEETLWTGDYVITQRNSSAEITAYIDVKGTHNITFDGLNLCYYGMVVELEGNITVKGTSNKNIFVCKKIDGLDSHGIIYTGLYCEGDIVFESGIIETDSIDYSIYISKTYGNSHPIIDGASITALNKVFINSSLDTLTLNSGTLNVRNVSGVTAQTGFGTMYVNGGLAIIDSERFIIGKKGIIMGGSMCFVPNTNTNGEITNAFGDELECVVYDTFPSEAERTFTNSDGTTYVYALTEADCADDGKYYVWKPVEPETPEGVAINAENFPDEVFREYVSTHIDTDGDGYLSQEECDAKTRINVDGTSSADGGITSLDGIENFSKLQTLYCYYNSGLTSLDVSKNTALTNLNCHDTQITSLDVSKNTALTRLDCYNTQITSLDVSKNTALTELWCYNTPITSLDVSKNTALTLLECSETPITSLDVSKNTALTDLYCSNTQIISLDVSKNTALTAMLCRDTQITSLDVSKNTALTRLDCYNTQITSLDVSKNTALKYLYCYNTQITSLDVSNTTALSHLYCYNTQIPFVDISKNPNITSFNASGNKYPIPADTLQFDITSDMNFTGFDPTRVSNVQGADFHPESGIFDNFTAKEITYTYDCKGTGESQYMKTFTLVRTNSISTASISEDTTPTPLPPNDTNTTPPPSSPDTGADASLPPEDIEGLRYLPLGILALAANRKRKTAFRVKRKAEI